MEIAIVVQRYGTDVVGGAEAHARKLAEQLAQSLGWQIHIFTTTAKDYQSWSNSYEEKIESVNGVLVHRFPVTRERGLLFKCLNRPLSILCKRCGKIPVLRRLTYFLEILWYWLQGPYCPKLLSDLAQQQHHFEKIIFFTYLYYPTVFGLPKLAKKSILVPTAHDELPFYFQHTKALFAAAGKILANSDAEISLINRTYNISNKISVGGLGFDDDQLDPSRLKTAFSSPVEGRYILYLGRIGKGKNTDALINYFSMFADSFDQDIQLVLAGEKDPEFEIPISPRISYLGFIEEERKPRLISDASCLVNPSAFESLSMVVIEAMALKVPILINKKSEVLLDYSKLHGSVFGYEGYKEFNDNLVRILRTDWQECSESQSTLKSAREWAIDKFSWNQVLAKYTQAITS